MNCYSATTPYRRSMTPGSEGIERRVLTAATLSYQLIVGYFDLARGHSLQPEKLASLDSE
jgi:hypothetical protein